MNDLDTMIDKLRDYKMSAAERREQRISFVYGNCHIENPNVTREMVIEADRKMYHE